MTIQSLTDSNKGSFKNVSSMNVVPSASDVYASRPILDEDVNELSIKIDDISKYESLKDLINDNAHKVNTKKRPSIFKIATLSFIIILIINTMIRFKDITGSTDDGVKFVQSIIALVFSSLMILIPFTAFVFVSLWIFVFRKSHDVVSESMRPTLGSSRVLVNEHLLLDPIMETSRIVAFVDVDESYDANQVCFEVCKEIKNSNKFREYLPLTKEYVARSSADSFEIHNAMFGQINGRHCVCVEVSGTQSNSREFIDLAIESIITKNGSYPLSVSQFIHEK